MLWMTTGRLRDLWPLHLEAALSLRFAVRLDRGDGSR